MQVIDLGSSAVFEVVVDGKKFTLREPMVEEVKDLSKKQEDLKDEMESSVLLTDFIVSLGMPKDVMDSLGIIRLKLLVDGIMGGLAEKK